MVSDKIKFCLLIIMSEITTKIFRYILFINRYLFKINERINEILFNPLTLSGPVTVTDASTSRCSIAGNSLDLTGGLGVGIDGTFGGSVCILGSGGCLENINGGTCQTDAALSVLNGGAYFHKSICANHQVIVNSGTLAKPAYTFCNETSSGLLRLAPREMNFSITGVETIRITPSSFELRNPGMGIRLNDTGTNSTVGQASFSASQTVTIFSNSVISATGITSFIFITPIQTTGTLSITNVSPGSFTVSSTNLVETGSFNWLIINPTI